MQTGIVEAENKELIPLWLCSNSKKWLETKILYDTWNNNVRQSKLITVTRLCCAEIAVITIENSKYIKIVEEPKEKAPN